MACVPFLCFSISAIDTAACALAALLHTPLAMEINYLNGDDCPWAE